jgi:hypothetical protein
MHASSSSFLITALASVVSAQQALTVPSINTAQDAETLCEVAGLTQRFRQQILVRSSLLDTAVGREIVALTFRRDGQYNRALGSGSAELEVTLSRPTLDPAFTQPAFAANVGTVSTQVFAGRVALPSSPALVHRNAATWTPPHAVAIPFARPYTYAGGTLCIDLTGEPVAGAGARFWPIDAVLTHHSGQVLSVGSACDPRLQAHGSRATLVPAGTVRLLSAGPASSLGIAMLGSPPQLPGLDLGFLNAPGCKLYLSPLVSLPATYSQPTRGTYGDINLKLSLPASAALVGGAFGTQWVNYPNPTTPSRLATSMGLHLQIAGTLLTYDVVQVRTGPLAAGVVRTEGEVIANVAPVFQLTLQ